MEYILIKKDDEVFKLDNRLEIPEGCEKVYYMGKFYVYNKEGRILPVHNKITTWGE